MRISTSEQATIRQTVYEVVGVDARVSLFGSRVNDEQRGGDIDLFVEVAHKVDQPILLAARIGARLQRLLGEQRIDVLIATPDTAELAIHRVARQSGVLL